MSTVLKSAVELAFAEANATKVTDAEAKSLALRSAKAKELVEAGHFPSVAEALRFLNVRAKIQNGETVAPEMRRYVEAADALIDQFEELHSIRAEAFAREHALNGLKSRRDVARKAVENERAKIAQIAPYQKKMLSDYRDHLAGKSDPQAFAHGFAVNIHNMGVYEKFMLEEIMPGLERDLAQVEKELAALEDADKRGAGA